MWRKYGRKTADKSLEFKGFYRYISVWKHVQPRGETPMNIRLGLAIVSLAFLVSACGVTPGDRAVSGAGIGAAGGAVVGAMVGDPFAGAAIGAVAGGAVGAATTPSQVDLGKPVWE